MAEFKPTSKQASDFNNGKEYVNEVDAVQADTINNIIESQLWTQKLAENPIDNTEANRVGEAKLSIVQNADGTPRLKAKNLKGDVGDKGDQGTGISKVEFIYNGEDPAPTPQEYAVIDGDYPNMTVGKAINDGAGNNIANQFTDINADIADKYTKPSSGIPESDLSNSVREKLNKESGGEVSSVNGQTGAVTVTPENIGAVKVGGIYTGDLNSLLENGTYKIDDRYGTPENMPPAVPNGQLIVTYNGDTSAQVYITYRSKEMWVRGGHGHGIWTDWFQIANKEDVLPLSGWTMTGDLTISGEGNGIKYKSGNRDSYALRFFQGAPEGYGDLVELGDGGITIVGAGESAYNIRSQLSSYDSEYLYLAADDNINLIAGADNYNPTTSTPTVQITSSGLYEKGQRVYSPNNPLGFNSHDNGQAWGSQTGAFITGFGDSTGGSIAFRRDNPIGGQMSMIIDGTVYVNEGNDEVYSPRNLTFTVSGTTLEITKS